MDDNGSDVFAFRIETYVNALGREVQGRFHVAGHTPDDFVAFHGNGKITIGEEIYDVMFPIAKAMSVKQAFHQFEEAAKATMPGIVKKMMAQKRAHDQEQLGKLVIPSVFADPPTEKGDE